MRNFSRPTLFGVLLLLAPITSALSEPAAPPLWIDRPEALPWADALARAAARAGVPAGVLAELIGTESGFRNVKNATSSARGFGQQIDGNAVMRVCRLDRRDPEDSIMGAALELRARLDQTGSLAGALRGYGTTAALSPARLAAVLRRFSTVERRGAQAAAVGAPRS